MDVISGKEINSKIMEVVILGHELTFQHDLKNTIPRLGRYGDRSIIAWRIYSFSDAGALRIRNREWSDVFKYFGR